MSKNKHNPKVEIDKNSVQGIRTTNSAGKSLNLRDSIWLQPDSYIGGFKSMTHRRSNSDGSEEIQSIVQESVENVDISSASTLQSSDNILNNVSNPLDQTNSTGCWARAPSFSGGNQQ